jgi:hypothetical protein
MRQPLLLGAAAAVACAAAAAPASAARPANGVIAFSRITPAGVAIFTVAPGGGTPERLVAGGFPDWDPSGRFLAFVRGDAIWTVSASGRGATRIVRGGTSPAFSTSGDQIAYVKGGSLWVAKVDGTGATRVFRHARDWAVASPDWTPGDARIAFNYVRTDTEPPDLPVVQIRTYALAGSGAAAGVLHRPAADPAAIGGWVNGGVSLAWRPQGGRIAVTMTGGPANGPGIGLGTLSSSGGRLGAPRVIGAAHAAWAPDGRALCLTGPAGLSTLDFGGTTPTTIVPAGRATIGACSWRPRP